MPFFLQETYDFNNEGKTYDFVYGDQAEDC